MNIATAAARFSTFLEKASVSRVNRRMNRSEALSRLDRLEALHLPFAPPQRLVVVGLYRYVRNPMYLGFAVGWVGLWVVFGHANSAAIAAAAAVALGVHMFVALYEEPTLRKKFGADYEEYCRNVGRWLPRVQGWDKPQ